MNHKSRLHLRIDPETKRLATRASALAGSSNLSDFVAFAIREKAAQTINEAESIKLNDQDYEAFMLACSAESLPNPALKAAQCRRRSRLRVGLIKYSVSKDADF